MTKETKETKKEKVVEGTLQDKLRYIQSSLKVPKNQFNKFGNYYYRNSEDILEAVKPLLVETKTILTITDAIDLIGTRYYVRATVTLWENGDTISKVSVTAYAREPESRKGMDEAQITGATSSYARKYALNGLFAIDDARDPDVTNKHEDSKEPAGVESHPKTSAPTFTGVTINPDESKTLNLVIETLAPKLEDGYIVDVEKLKKVILAEYGQLPTKAKSAEVVIKYITKTLGFENVATKNDFIAGLEK